VITRPLSTEQVIAAFGDPAKYLNAEGMPGREWEDEILAWCPLPAPLPLSWERSRTVERFRCHRLVRNSLKAALAAVYAVPEAWATVNDFGGCYAWRVQRKAAKILSRHCWGIAVDLDVGDNPFGREPQVHPMTLASFEAHGFAWGGRFSPRRRDGMHFEFADLGKISS